MLLIRLQSESIRKYWHQMFNNGCSKEWKLCQFLDEGEKIGWFGQLWCNISSLKPKYRHCTVAGLLEKSWPNQWVWKTLFLFLRSKELLQVGVICQVLKNVVYSVPRCCSSPVMDITPESWPAHSRINTGNWQSVIARYRLYSAFKFLHRHWLLTTRM